MAYRSSVPPSPSPSQRSEQRRSAGLQADGRPGSGRSARSAGQRHSTGSSIYGYLVEGENKIPPPPPPPTKAKQIMHTHTHTYTQLTNIHMLLHTPKRTHTIHENTLHTQICIHTGLC